MPNISNVGALTATAQAGDTQAMPSRFEPMKGKLLRVNNGLAFMTGGKLYKVLPTKSFAYQAQRLQSWSTTPDAQLFAKPAIAMAYVEDGLVPTGFQGAIRVNVACVDQPIDTNLYSV